MNRKKLNEFLRKITAEERLDNKAQTDTQSIQKSKKAQTGNFAKLSLMRPCQYLLVQSLGLTILALLQICRCLPTVNQQQQQYDKRENSIHSKKHICDKIHVNKYEKHGLTAVTMHQNELPLSSIRQHSDINDCLKDNREDY